MLVVSNSVRGGGTSAALPTIGSRISPTKVTEIPLPSTIPSILATKHSAQIATNTVDASKLG
jgi:hypothetical protein